MKYFNEYDNIDRDIIRVNKDSLILKVQKCKEFFSSSSSAFGYGSASITFLASSYLTEMFHNVGPIPGETIRATFIVLGVLFAIFTIQAVINWFKFHKDHEPEQIVANLLKDEVKRGIRITENAKDVLGDDPTSKGKKIP